MRTALAFVILAALVAGCTPGARYVLDDCMEDSAPIPASIILTSNGVVLSSALGGLVGSYPNRASRMEIGGNATIRCVLVDGRPQRCDVVSETPLDLGFGNATVKLAKQLVFPTQQTEAEIVAEFRVVGPSPPSVPCGFATPEPPKT
ncbi:MAG: hypothetical protein ACOY4K_14280 [Pseudomonadota bacterium]